jgi:hypothetical protein
LSGTAFALVVYALLWGLAVEVADRILGDPFEPLDVFTLALQIALAILLWPLARRMFDRRSG